MLFVQPAVKINSATLATVTTTLKKVYCKTFVVFQTTISFSSRLSQRTAHVTWSLMRWLQLRF